MTSKRGGPRPGFGGKQPGAGRPVRNIRLDAATAKELHILKRTHPGALDEHGIVANLIHEAYAEFDTDAQARGGDETA